MSSQFLKVYVHNYKRAAKTKGPHSGGLKNTNDEKNLFRKIQTEYYANCFYTLPLRRYDILNSYELLYID